MRQQRQLFQEKNDDSRKSLQQCFDLIAQERSSYYPTDPELVELVLVADSTLGDDLTKQLDSPSPCNWLFSGRLLQEIQGSPALEKLNARVQAKSAAMVGGQQVELPSALVSIEALTNQIAAGLDFFESQDITVETFATRSFGVGPHLPQVLTQFGFKSAIHAAFSGGDIPTNCAPIMNWQGLDGTNFPAMAMNPLDAGSASSFLGLGIKIGEILDSHHHCPMLLVHWPGRTSEYFLDLVRVLRYAPIFGEFVTVKHLNESIYDNGFSESHESDSYRFPWLQTSVQCGQADPISRYCKYWRNHFAIQAVLNWYSVLTMLESTPQYSKQIEAFEDLLLSNERALILGSNEDVSDQVDVQLDSCQEFFLKRQPKVSVEPNSTLVNPMSVHQTLALDVAGAAPDIGRLQPFGFASLGLGEPTIGASSPELVVEDPDSGIPVLRNDFLKFVLMRILAVFVA